MKTFVLSILLMICGSFSMAQIQITPYLAQDRCDKLPDGICEILSQKLYSVISQNGLQSNMGDSRFVLTCNVTEESKNVLSTSPMQIAYVLDVHLYIGDGEIGTKYISQSFRAKGVGATEEKAYRNAIKNLNAKSEQMTAFIGQGCARIINYYETNKTQILSSINACIAGKDFERAAYELYLIPQECSYYTEVQALLGKVNRHIVDANSSQLLISAKSIWAAEQSENSANRVAEIVSNIDPNASCYSEAEKLLSAITERMEQLNNREWAARQRQLAHEREMAIIRENNRSTETQMRIKAQRDQNMATIKAVRDVAVEYAKNRPRMVYHVHRWY